MKHLKLAAVGIFVLSLVIQSAFATSYDFSEAGWPGGGEITGSFDIDLNQSTVIPGFLFADALTSFSAHWSGNPYSQSYDWNLSQVSDSDFLFSIGGDTIVDLVLNGDVLYDDQATLVWDDRPTAIKSDPNDPSAQYYGTGPLVVTRANAVPEANHTGLLLFVALVFLGVFGRQRRWSRIRAAVNRPL